MGSPAPAAEQPALPRDASVHPPRVMRAPLPRQIIQGRAVPPPWRPLEKQQRARAQLPQGTRPAWQAEKIVTIGSLGIPVTPRGVQLGMTTTDGSPRKTRRRPHVPRARQTPVEEGSGSCAGDKTPPWCALSGRPLSNEGGRFSRRGVGYKLRTYVGEDRALLARLATSANSASAAAAANGKAKAAPLCRPSSAISASSACHKAQAHLNQERQAFGAFSADFCFTPRLKKANDMSAIRVHHKKRWQFSFASP